MTLPNVHPKRMADEHLLPAALLETGDTLNFLEVRKHSLRVKIKDSKLSAATGKVSGLSAVASGGLLYFTLANPLGALLACGGLAAYGLAVSAQWLQTGKLHPFPLTSKTADESDEELSASTLTGGSLQIARSHIHEEASYLEPREKAEYELLHHAPQGLINAVSSVAPAQRWACYCFLLDAHRTGNLDDYRDRATLETVLGNASVYHSHLPEAVERFPEIGLDSGTAQPPSLPGANDALPTATSSPIGATTKLGAVEVPASPAAQTSGASWQTPESQIAPQTPVTSKLREGCDRNNSFYVAGSKGSGKGIFAANLLRWKLDQYPNAIALILDPKGDLKEAGYWQHERIRHFSFKGIALSSEQYAEKVIEFLSEARNLVSQADVTRGMRLFLVLDELLTIKESVSNGLFAEFRRFGVSAISTGDSEGIHLIAITQSFNAGDSFGSDELLKNFTQVGLFREDEYTRAKKLIQFGRSNGELAESEFKALIAQSLVDRVMSIAGEFIPTPKLENHSAFDRDSGKVIKQMPLGSSPSEGDILASELKEKIQQLTVASDETDSDELAIRAEVKRFLLANAEGSKPRDLSARARKPVKGMTTDDIKFVLDLMTLEGDIYEVEGTYFANTN